MLLETVLGGWLAMQSRAAERTGALSFAAELETRWMSDSGRHRFVAKPFVRIDAHGGERTHADIRELYWQRNGSRTEMSLGVRKIFWGVSESQHLVDIINQSDLIEDFDGEDKLGQPLASGAVRTPAGRFELILMPLFRERAFPGDRGRLRTGHLDTSGRWSISAGAWDAGLSHFSGRSREPDYPLIDQTSLDLQATHGPMLTKVEVISRRGDGDRYEAATAGFEYTFGDVRASGADIGVLLEYLYDSRGAQAATPFESDVFAGTRIALNDTQSTELLAGAIIDLDDGDAFLNVEASRRIGAHWKVNVTARSFAGPLRRNRYIEIELLRYFTLGARRPSAAAFPGRRSATNSSIASRTN